MPNVNPEKKRDHPERRRDPRRAVEGYQIKGTIQPIADLSASTTATGPIIQYHMMDFSTEGYRMHLYEPIKMGTPVLVTFLAVGQWQSCMGVSEQTFNQLDHILRQDDDIQCHGIVIWRQGLNADKGYQIGIHLTETSLQNKFHSLLSAIMG